MYLGETHICVWILSYWCVCCSHFEAVIFCTVSLIMICSGCLDLKVISYCYSSCSCCCYLLFLLLGRPLQKSKGSVVYNRIGMKFGGIISLHRRTSQGAEGCSPQTREKPLFFGQKLNFSGKNQQPKMKKVFLYPLNEKNGIRSV